MRFKQTTLTDYLNRAVSTDSTRPSLCAPWQEKTHLVATDGHRLHGILDCKDEIKAPISFNPTIASSELPEYERVIPTSPVIGRCIITHETFNIKQLRGIAKLINTRLENCSFKLDKTSITFKLHADSSLSSNAISIEFKALLAVLIPYDTEVFINLNYFIDAIEGLNEVTLDIHDKYQALVFNSELEGKKTQALVMPKRR